MGITLLFALSSPITWLIAVMLVATWRNHRERRLQLKYGRKRPLPVGTSATAVAAAAFQFLSLAYRPNHAFVAKAQIQQQEDADDDDDGGPDTPIRHLHRQLRRIRRGEPVETLIWRLE
jgi:hypothetical protein